MTGRLTAHDSRTGEQARTLGGAKRLVRHEAPDEASTSSSTAARGRALMARDGLQLRTLMRGALRGGTSIVLATVSADGVPATALNSWIIAKDEDVVALAVDKRSTAYQNISAGRVGVAFELLADDLILAVRGTAQIVHDLESVPFPCALAHIRVESVRDHSVAGVRFTGPRYTYADDKEHRGAIERGILDELGKDVKR